MSYKPIRFLIIYSPLSKPFSIKMFICWRPVIFTIKQFIFIRAFGHPSSTKILFHCPFINKRELVFVNDAASYLIPQSFVYAIFAMWFIPFWITFQCKPIASISICQFYNWLGCWNIILILSQSGISCSQLAYFPPYHQKSSLRSEF